jgi:hypothetical protein
MNAIGDFCPPILPNVVPRSLTIKDLLGHTIAGVTSVYARLTPDVLENAVERLAETTGKVGKFERKVS